MKRVDFDMDEVGLETAIMECLEHARTEHPYFAHGKYEALGVVLAEVDELIHAVEHESDERALNEALDVVVTAMRFANREYEHGGRRDHR